jgi:erythronate-4-phosphate dehydrogenase
MIIAVDEQIPYWEKAFAQFGDIRLFSGRDLTYDELSDVDILIVRTITPVNASLLEGTSVRFVAAASAGIDHIDQAYLKGRKIPFCYSAGSNADSVAEYITTVLHAVASRRGWDLKRKSIAVIGVGHVGSRVARKAEALGMQVYLCDPPLRESTEDPRYQLLDDVLEADILTFHVPLSSDEPFPTFHMLNRQLLDRMSPGQFVINSCRGAVFDGRELRSALKEKRIAGAVLDVWEGEPVIDNSLLELVDIGTPHIAGVALDGKIRSTEMVRQKLGEFLGIPSVGLPDSLYPEARSIRPESETIGQEAVRSVLVQAFEILRKDAQLRSVASLSAVEAAPGFDRLRNERPLRLEFRHFTVELDKTHIELAGTFQALGFGIRME